MTSINPHDWHESPKGHNGRCPVCDCPEEDARLRVAFVT